MINIEEPPEPEPYSDVIIWIDDKFYNAVTLDELEGGLELPEGKVRLEVGMIEE